ncbi:MAG: hypothetical protein PHQ96_06860, partial [Candidatus Omnitrophica bacterium]|nr:hypothetical protein [Candidatus Omnitrophota bacterium]
AFFGTLPQNYKNIKEVPVLMKTTMILLSCICIGAGVLLMPQLRQFFLQPAQEVISRGLDYKNAGLTQVYGK